jgi:protein ImuB
VWLTDWPLDRLRRTGGAAPGETGLALTERAAEGLRVVAADGPARAQGIVPGLTLADARARAPALASAEIDRAADAAALEALARWAMRYTPSAAVDGPDGLMLDVTGCAHLWSGESEMMADLSARLDRAGLAHRLGLGPAPGAAWALAHGAGERLARLEGDPEAGLADLPVNALRLSEETLTLLRRFGLARIGQLSGIPRAALARRFRSAEAADRVLLRLDQALGRVAEPLGPLAPPPEHAARLPCPEPLLDAAGVAAGLGRLLARLADELAAAGRGARRFTLRAFRADGTADALEIGTARPARDPAHLARLFEDRLERLDPGHGIDLLTLEAHGLAAMEETPRPLARGFAGADTDPQALAALADRLAARLGEGAVAIASPVGSHLPERAERTAPFAGGMPDWTGAPTPLAPRPLRLLDRPEPVEVLAEVPDGPPVRFVWRRVARAVRRADGPERIGPEWWRAAPGPAEALPRARDYYRVEDADGRRYWLYREGLYGDGRGEAPRWFVHGLFA